MTTAAHAFETFVGSYFAVVTVVCAALAFVGIRALVAQTRRRSSTALVDLVANDYYEAISILVPAYNEQRTIVESVQSMLNLQHPHFDVIVTNDGSTDGTMDELIQHFSLIEVPVAHDETIKTEPIRRMFRSLDHATLTVLDKEYGGRSDALNAALNLARRPLVCVAPNDSRFDPRALMLTSRAFIEDESVVAVAGAVRPNNGAEPSARSWSDRVQLVQFARDHLVTAAGWARAGALSSTSGFAMFRRHSLVEVGGWRTSTGADDIDMGVRLHRHYREAGRPYRIAFIPEEICWSTAPSTLGDVVRTRHDRTRALIEALRQHGKMLFNPRYGSTGLLAVPFRWLVDVCAPVIETAAYAYIVATAAFGRLNVGFVVAFLALTMGYGIVASQLAIGAETLVAPRYARLRDRVALAVAAVFEQIALRPVLMVARLHATLPARRYARKWRVTPRIKRDVSRVEVRAAS